MIRICFSKQAFSAIYALSNKQNIDPSNCNYPSNSPYCLPYSFYDVSLENLVLDQFTIPLLIFFFILITCLLDIVIIL